MAYFALPGLNHFFASPKIRDFPESSAMGLNNMTNRNLVRVSEQIAGPILPAFDLTRALKIQHINKHDVAIT